jgi:hypothetical protein
MTKHQPDVPFHQPAVPIHQPDVPIYQVAMFLARAIVDDVLAPANLVALKKELKGAAREVRETSIFVVSGPMGSQELTLWLCLL